MAGGSPTAFLLWSVLSCLFYCFLIFHLWNYDRFKCLRWSEASRRPGAFKRVMTYTYITTLTLLVLFGAAFTLFKFKEGYLILPGGTLTSRPLEMYSHPHRKWILPLLFLFSVAWACELITHLEELTFWLFLQNQGPRTRIWFDSWEFKLWLYGSMVAILGMPLTALVTRKHLDSCLAWILCVGSSASTIETLSFIFVLVRFPAFIHRVKDDGAAPNIIVRLVYSYQLNCARVIFRFLFTIPLLTLGIDGIQGLHPVNLSAFWSDFLLILGGVSCFVSSGITLLVFFPRSLITELGYTITSPAVTAVKTPASPSTEFRQVPVHYPECAVAKHSLHPTPSSSVDSHQDASPDYEPEDPSNPPRPHSYDGHVRMRVWDPHRAEASGANRSSAPYLFDERLKGLVGSHSDSPGLHPYIRGFKSPIDIYDADNEV